MAIAPVKLYVNIIYTSLQADNHASTSSTDFYRSDVFPDAQSIVSKHRRQKTGPNLWVKIAQLDTASNVYDTTPTHQIFNNANVRRHRLTEIETQFKLMMGSDRETDHIGRP